MKCVASRVSLVLALWCSFVLGVCAQGSAPGEAIAVTYGPPSHSNILGSTFVNWDAMIAKPTDVGEYRAVFDNPTPTLEKLEVHVTTLLPGKSSHPPHHHPWEEMLVIKEGELEVTLNGQPRHARSGSLVFFAAHDPHNARNSSDQPVTYYVINFYTDLVHTVPNKPAAEQAVPGRLPSSIFDCNALPVTATATGSTVNIVNSPTLTFLNLSSHITTLNVGESTRAEQLDPGDEIFVLKSGLLEATVNGVTSRIKEGSLFYCAPNDKRGFRNMGSTPTSYMVIKVVSDKTPK